MAKRKLTGLQRSEELGNKPIDTMLRKLSFPAMIGMMVTVLYNVVDTVFVARYAGTMAIGGMAVVLPITMLISTIGMAIGVGGGSMIARFLGAGEHERAAYTFGNMGIMTLVLTILPTVAGYIFVDEVLHLFGASGELLPYAKAYYNIVLAGAPILAVAMMMNNGIRSEGKAKASMTTMLISAVLNTILDAIFIIKFGWGIEGAAIATVISQLLAMMFLAWYYASGRSAVRMGKKYYVANKKLMQEIWKVGTPSFARQGAGSILAIVVNHALMQYGGEVSVAIYGILGRIFMMAIFPMFGLAQGMMPLVSYNIGAEKYDRVEETLRKSILAATIASIVSYVLMLSFPELIISFFSDDAMVIDEGSKALKLMVGMFPVIGFQIVGAMYFQAIGKASPALWLTLSRQLLLLVPLVWILPKFLGLYGVWYAFPIADLLSFLMTLSYVVPEWKKLKRLEEEKHAMPLQEELV